MTFTIGRLLALVALILFILATLISFGAASVGNADGIAFVGLACLAGAHLIP